ncbi:MAG: sterol desaturase family protein [Thermoanaerobaculia bacterium]
MTGWLVAHEAAVRAASFAGVFAVMALAEVLFAARPLRAARPFRWANNLGIMLLNTALLRLVFPAGATVAALWAGEYRFGILQRVDLPELAELVLAVVALDFIIYWQHRAFHAVPLLFRFHEVHHADIDFDVTLGSRFHPVEMLLSMGIKLGAVVTLGASPAAVVVFETILAVTSLFSHGNLALPAPLDRILRWLLVTPAMHSVHHSAVASEQQSNFGFFVPWWDRLFGTYRQRSEHAAPVIGISEFQAESAQNIVWMLALPFRHAQSRATARVKEHQEAA